MDFEFTYIIAAFCVIVVITILVVISTRKKKNYSQYDSPHKGGKGKTQAQIIKEANKKLEKNPHDADGLVPLGEVYFNSRLWEKAFPIYEELVRQLAGAGSVNDKFIYTLRLGICAVHLKKLQDGINSLSIAYKINPSNFEVNYYLGLACFYSEQYEKAIPCLKKSLIANPDAEGVYFILGQCMYKSRRYKECLPCFKKALDEDPSNKEALYDMADAMNQEGHGEKAIKVFMHLRPDPIYGARSSLSAGKYHTKLNDIEAAIQDYEIGLKHEATSVEIKLELQYGLAKAYLSRSQIAKGLNVLKSIRNINTNYKDVNSLINTYQELSQNSNLQIYLSSNSSDFVTLCRKFIAVKYKDSNVKIQSIEVDSLYTDLFAEVYTSNWEDITLFRFFRTSGSTGEMYVRDFHGHMQDLKATRGFCISAGTFTEEAHKYIEGRPVDIIEKTELTKVLKLINF